MSEHKESLAELRIDRGEEPRNGSGRTGWIVLIVLLLALGGGAVWWTQGRAVAVRTQAARVAESANGKRTVLNASGYVLARRQATVSSKVTGKVVEILVEEGMKVQDGQVLARLDDTNVRANLKLAEAQTEAAKAALAETRARLEEAEKQFKRTSDLTSKNVASASEFDRAEAEVKSLRARLESQASQISVAEREVAVWQQQLEDTVIRAPFAGVAISKNAQPGEMISPISAGGGFTRTGIGTIVDMKSLEIEVDVNESFIKRVQTGQPIEAVLDAYPDWKIACKVIAIIPAADRQKATVKVRVGFEQLDPRILPDMGVKVAFLGTAAVGTEAPEVLVPKVAVREDGGRSVVWVVKDGRLTRRVITTGITKGSEVSIASGLSEGEKIMIEGPAKPVEGMAVRERS